MAVVDHTHIKKKVEQPVLKFKCPNQKNNVEKLETYFSQFESHTQQNSPRLPVNIQSFLKPSDKLEIGRDATINRFKKLFSFTGNDFHAKEINVVDEKHPLERRRTSQCYSDEKYEKIDTSPRDMKIGLIVSQEDSRRVAY